MIRFSVWARVIMDGKGEPHDIPSDHKSNGSKHHHPVLIILGIEFPIWGITKCNMDV